MIEPYPRPDKKPSANEVRKPQPKRAYLFDVDGVLTNPITKRIEQPGIFDELVKRLKRGEPVGLNTGRSLAFMNDTVLTPLEQKIADKALLHNMIAVGEKGSAWIVYDEYGQKTTHLDQSVSVPQTVQQEIRALIQHPPYNDLVFYDETKQTMVSIELQTGKTIEEFHEPQKQMNAALLVILTRRGLAQTLRIDPTRISTDVENIHVGKSLGARRFVEILGERGIDPEEYIGFGDSASDFFMEEELHRLGKKSQFVFVGGRDHFGNHPTDGVIFTQENVDKGTLTFLQQEK